MQRSERHRTIIRSVTSGARVTTAALAELTGASEITIRRDLQDLADAGLVRRVRGGATRPDPRGTPMPFAARFEADRARKDALAVAVAGLVEDDVSLIVDNGTTCYAVARHLAGRRLTVLALSLHAAAAIAARPGATVLVPGGKVQNDSLAFTGPEASSAVARMNVDVAILGACSAQPGFGLTATDHDDAQLKRACLVSAARRILVTTAEKLTRASTFSFGEISDLTHLVTTRDAPRDVLAEFRASGVQVSLIADVPGTVDA